MLPLGNGSQSPKTRERAPRRYSHSSRASFFGSSTTTRDEQPATHSRGRGRFRFQMMMSLLLSPARRGPFDGGGPVRGELAAHNASMAPRVSKGLVVPAGPEHHSMRQSSRKRTRCKAYCISTSTTSSATRQTTHRERNPGTRTRAELKQCCAGFVEAL